MSSNGMRRWNMDEKKQIDCIHYDAELECCKVLSDWLDPMPVLAPCVESPCGLYEPGNPEIGEKENER